MIQDTVLLHKMSSAGVFYDEANKSMSTLPSVRSEEDQRLPLSLSISQRLNSIQFGEEAMEEGDYRWIEDDYRYDGTSCCSGGTKKSLLSVGEKTRRLLGKLKPKRKRKNTPKRRAADPLSRV